MVYLLKYPLADVIAQEIYNVKFFKVSSSFLLLFKWLLLIRLPCFPIASQFFIINRFYLDYKGQFLHLFKGLDLFLERIFIIS